MSVAILQRFVLGLFPGADLPIQSRADTASRIDESEGQPVDKPLNAWFPGIFSRFSGTGHRHTHQEIWQQRGTGCPWAAGFGSPVGVTSAWFLRGDRL